MSTKQHAYFHVVSLILIVVAFTAVHGTQFSENLAQTHWEDKLFFDHSKNNIHSIADCFRTSSVWPGLYRPITTNCYYYFGREGFDNQIEIYHTINAIMVCINSWLLYMFFQRLLMQGRLLPEADNQWSRFVAVLAFIPGLLFVTRQAHAEVVLNTVEFQALFYVFAGFMMLLLATTLPSVHQSRGGYTMKLLGGAACLLVALLSKEAAISIGVIWIVYLLLLQRNVRAASFLPPLLISGVWGILFVWVLRGFSQYEPTGFSYLATFDNILTNYGAYFFSFFNWVSTDGDSVMPERAIELALSQLGRGIMLFLMSVSVGVLIYAIAQVTLQTINRQGWRLAPLLAETTYVDKPLLAPFTRYFLYIGFSITFFFIATAPFVIFEHRLFARYGYLGHAGIAMAISFMIIGVTAMLQKLLNQTNFLEQCKSLL